MLLLAGGTGLAPILSLVRKLKTDGSQRKAHLVYGVSTDEDLVAVDQLQEVAAGLTGFTWDHCVADPASTAVNKGYVTGLIRPEHLYDGDVAIYLCGPPPMVEAVRKHVVDAGIEPIGFYYEKFALALPAAAKEAAAESVAAAAQVAPAAPREELLVAPDARAVAGQVMLPEAEIVGPPASVSASDPGDVVRRIAGPADGTRRSRHRRGHAARRGRRDHPQRGAGDRRPGDVPGAGGPEVSVGAEIIAPAVRSPAAATTVAPTATRSARSTPESTSPTRFSRPARPSSWGRWS